MDGQRWHLVQKQGDDYDNALSPTHGGDQSLPQLQLHPLHLARGHGPHGVQQAPHLLPPLVVCLSLLPWKMMRGELFK